MKNPELATFIGELCILLGLNTAHDYDGIESDTDVKIYSDAIKRKITKLVEMNIETKNQIQKDYEKITSFSNGELGKLAKKYNLTEDELLDIIDL